MAEQIEIVFDENTGKFVVHFSGVATHDQEHQILDQLIANLEKQGFDVNVEHYHDKPKLPDLDPVQVWRKNTEGLEQ